jgi:sirohydrochlorin cobaltochelatase
MPVTSEQRAALDALDSRVRTILPDKYEDSYEDVQPVSMGSAGLKFGQDGKVAWDEMWDTFCDLAMAGGPPHKGMLLQPASPAEIDAQPDRYQEVVEEICRGIDMAANLTAVESPVPGWIRVSCVNQGTADWLLRAITMENVAVRREGLELDLPAGPSFRIEKEIKNVITVVAKTSHYWFGHIFQEKRKAIRDLFAAMEAESPLLQPVPQTPAPFREKISATIRSLTGLNSFRHDYAGWLGIESPDIASAVWTMRALIASNILSRREATFFFVPLDPVHDPDGEKTSAAIARLHALAAVRSQL